MSGGKEGGRARAGEPAAPDAPDASETSAPTESARTAGPTRPAQPAEGDRPAGPFFVASHEVLFAPAVDTRCDACGGPVGRGDDGRETDGAQRFAPDGEGVYLWARGDEVRFERAPLCASCASAIGMTALARWEIEEEEG